MTKEKKKVFIMIAIFLSIIPSIIFLLIGTKSLLTLINSNRYKLGVLKIKSIDCGSGYGGDDSNCYGYGTINDNDYVVNLGLTPDKISLFENTEANLSKGHYDVFYIENEEKAILRVDGEVKINTIHYLKKSILELIFPVLILPLLIYYYYSLKNEI